jgi:2-oxo-4-hydroxy-4-carboxy--5-ureidoimidazoline (OHCU) decarboxylase
MKQSKSIFNLSLLLGLMLGAPLAFAQQQPPPPQEQMAPEGTEAQELDEASKEKFVVAYIKVHDIQTQYTVKLQDVTDQNEAQALQQAAQQEMISAVESSGLSVTEYNEMTQIVASDPELQAEIQQRAGSR